jgi:hypothetical protein
VETSYLPWWDHATAIRGVETKHAQHWVLNNLLGVTT